MIPAIIIDDEQHCCESLQWQLKQYCPDVSVVELCNNAESGMQAISRLDPKLVFLDVEMPGMSGFEMLESLGNTSFGLIFTTAYDRYAIRAIKFGAMDYLVKPIDKDELRTSIDTFLKRTKNDSVQQLSALLSHVSKNHPFSFQKIAFPTMHSYELVPLSDIIVCEGNSNYTNVKLKNGQTMVVSKTLKEIEELLDGPPFFRIHNSWLVNLQYAIRYIKGEGGFLELVNNISIPVSRARKEELLKFITQPSV